MDHLNKVKQKLEVTLDELEDSHEREKKSRLDMEKQRRKLEADLKVTQEVVIDLERDKKELETMIEKKDKDIHDAMRRLEDEQVIVAKLQKAIKELQGRIESQEEELEAERQVRPVVMWCVELSGEMLVFRPAPRLRNREAASPGSWTTSQREWRRPGEPLRLRSTSTRRERPRSTS